MTLDLAEGDVGTLQQKCASYARGYQMSNAQYVVVKEAFAYTGDKGVYNCVLKTENANGQTNYQKHHVYESPDGATYLKFATPINAERFDELSNVSCAQNARFGALTLSRRCQLWAHKTNIRRNDDFISAIRKSNGMQGASKCTYILKERYSNIRVCSGLLPHTGNLNGYFTDFVPRSVTCRFFEDSREAFNVYKKFGDPELTRRDHWPPLAHWCTETTECNGFKSCVNRWYAHYNAGANLIDTILDQTKIGNRFQCKYNLVGNRNSVKIGPIMSPDM